MLFELIVTILFLFPSYRQILEKQDAPESSEPLPGPSGLQLSSTPVPRLGAVSVHTPSVSGVSGPDSEQ